MYLARFAVAKTLGDVGPAAYMPDGSIIAAKFNAQLLVSTSFASANPGSASFAAIGETVVAFNVHDKQIDAGSVIVIAQDVSEVWIVYCKYQ